MYMSSIHTAAPEAVAAVGVTDASGRVEQRTLLRQWLRCATVSEHRLADRGVCERGGVWLQAKFLTCCKTLTAYCRNVYMNIDDPTKRRINLENKAFQNRVAALPGGREFLAEVGFEVCLPPDLTPRNRCLALFV